MKVSAPRHYDENGYRNRAVSICFKDITFSEVFLITSHFKSDNLWKIPGGHIEKDEKPDEAAVREMFEEAGLKGEIVKLVGQYEDHKIKVRNFVFAVIVSSIEDEYDEVNLNRERQWFPVNVAIEHLAKYKSTQSFWLKNCINNLLSIDK